MGTVTIPANPYLKLAQYPTTAASTAYTGGVYPQVVNTADPAAAPAQAPIDGGGDIPQDTQLNLGPSRADTLRGTGNATLDELLALYDQVISQINSAVGSETERINGSYDDKVLGQGKLMDQGMRDTDAANAANNLGESSYMSSDRMKVKEAADANIGTINESRTGDLGELGKMRDMAVADYQGRKANLGTTRDRLSRATDEADIEATTNTLLEAKNGIPGEMAKYKSQGEFVNTANSLGKYDTTALDATIQGVIDNASASQESKNSTIKDIIDGTGMPQAKKDEYKNKYLQVV